MPPPGYVTCQPVNVTSVTPDDIGKDDLNALLYIVVTLLFYSMGIIIGIITYLKREQAEMEEDKMFDMYLQIKREPFNVHKKQRVDQMALYLKQLEEQRVAREKIEHWKMEQYLHSQPTSPCPVCSVIGGGGRDFSSPDGTHSCKHHAGLGLETAPLAMPETEWGEGGGASALLCSFTLGVCEPLLAPDSRRSSAQEVAKSNGGRGAGEMGSETEKMPYECTCRANSAFTASEEPSRRKQENTPPTTDSLRDAAEDAGEQIPEGSDMQVNKKRGFNIDEVKTVFQRRSSLEEDTAQTCQETSMPGPSYTRSVSVAATAARHKQPKLARQFSHDAERSRPGLAVHAPNPARAASSGITEDVIAGHMKDKLVRVNLQPCPPSKYNEEQKSGNHRVNRQMHSDGEHIEQQQYNLLPPSPPQLQQQQKQQKQQKEQQGLEQLPNPRLQQHHNNQYDPNSIHKPGPPHFSSSIPEIPTVTDSTSLYSSLRSPPENGRGARRRTPSPRYEAWRQGHAQTLDIPDSSLAGVLDSTPRPKMTYNEKKPVPRPQARDNERRGALLFTQKSLHHIENDSPKSDKSSGSLGSGRQYVRPNGPFGHQDSLDSRLSDMGSELEVSASHRDESSNPQLLPIPPLSPLPQSHSPTSLSKHQRRIPRLARSQTVDTPKVHYK